MKTPSLLRSAAAAATLSLTAAPLAAQADLYTLQPDLAGGQTGQSVASVGDLDGDGLCDFVAGSPGAEVSGLACGLVQAWSGRDGALLFSASGSQAGERFGETLAPGGDLDGDGVPDVLVGAPGFASNRGRVVALSGATGLVHTQLDGLGVNHRFGLALCSVGDVDGDAVLDFAVAAPFELAPGASVSGVVRVYSGAALTAIHTLAPWWTQPVGLGFGERLAGGFDWNGDGIGDLLVGTPSYSLPNGAGPSVGRAQVYSLASGQPSTQWVGSAAGDQLGRGLAGLDDLDGDGRGEVAIASPFNDASGLDAGRVRVYGIQQAAHLAEFVGSAGSQLGAALAALDAGDDAAIDLALGAPGFTQPGQGKVGSVRVVPALGGPPIDVVAGSQADASFGSALGGVGDLNGDSRDELLVGAPLHDGASPSSGLARLYLTDTKQPSTYCTGLANSMGCMPTMASSGAASLSVGDNFQIRATSVVNWTPGLMAYGFAPAATPFAGGTLCIGSPVLRTHGQLSGGTLGGADCTGSFAFHASQAWLASVGLDAGTTVYCQYWSRDPWTTSPHKIGLSNGLSFTVLP